MRIRMERKISNACGRGTKRKDNQPLRRHGAEPSERMSNRKMRCRCQFLEKAGRWRGGRLGQALEVPFERAVDQVFRFRIRMLSLFHVVLFRSLCDVILFSIDAFRSARAREARVQIAFGFLPSIAAISSKLYPL